MSLSGSSLASTQPLSPQSLPLSPMDFSPSQVFSREPSSFGKVPSSQLLPDSKRAREITPDHVVPNPEIFVQTRRPNLYVLNGPGEQEVPEMRTRSPQPPSKKV